MKEFEQMKLIVSQYDSDLALKANKSGFFEVEKIVHENKSIINNIN